MSDEKVTETITTTDHERWGKLVKTWATGRSFFLDDPVPITIDQLPIPRTLQEFKDQCRLVRAGVTVPDGVVGLTVIQHSADTLFIRLPPKSLVLKKHEEFGSSTGRYPFPDFYERFIGEPLEPVDRLKVHASRIGDYTISVCG
ncbi:MAG TPA: hypothetical protein VH913_16600 [Hyphomicrobiaceae bacterium]|jgi:hypothetical protein